ncbi:MAG: Hsp33 family molecular chaperone HslO, partial [Bacillota bacterium]|nr:Hsp33 family molecular chaperone HslO [Bacillota bacterium]
EIAKDLTYYFARSEQMPSSVALGVLVETDGSVRAAGGLMVHLLPGHPPELVDQLEQKLAHLPPVSSLVDGGARPEDLVAEVLGGMPFQELGRLPLRFTCACSMERLDRILITLGREELDEMVREGQAEIICRFCGQRYLFDRAHLERLRDEAIDLPEQRWRH